MVVTSAQKVSADCVGGHYQEPEQSEAGFLAPSVSFPALPSSPRQGDWIDALALQVQSLMVAVQHLQQQAAASQQGPRQPSPGARVTPPSQQSTNGRTSHREAPCRYTFLGHHHRKASKRPQLPSRHSDDSRKRRQERKTERGHHHRRYPSLSLGSSQKGSFSGRVVRRTERRLEEYNQQLEELSRRVTNPLEADYDSRPPLSRRIMEEPIFNRFRLPQLEPYDGTTDPMDHLKSYQVLMQVQRATDSLLCIVFLTTLRKAARA